MKTAGNAVVLRRWPLRLISVLIAATVWLVLSYLPRLERSNVPQIERIVEAELSFQNPRPESYMILNRDQEVSVLVRGPADLVRGLRSTDVDLQVGFPREPFPLNDPVEVALSAEDVSVPEGLEVVSLTPTRLPLLIDERRTAYLPVRPVFSGEPAAGLTVNDIGFQVSPPEVAVVGPRHRIEQLTEVATSPIDVNGRAFQFTARQVELVLTDPYARVQNTQFVEVMVTFKGVEEDLAEAPTRRR